MEKPYVFISYAHANSDRVLPAINQLKAQGVNIWYDNGIEAGSEWPEFVAEKVMHCQKFVLFISEGYLQSQNCKRELNFAISRKKEILSVFIEEVNLSPGMELQLGTYQALFRNRYSDDKSFFAAMAAEPFFNSCRDGVAPRPAPQPVPKPQPAPQPAPKAGFFGTDMGQFQDLFGGQTPKAQPVRPTPPPVQPSPVIMDDYNLPAKNKVLAGILAIFLGCLGIHKFYLGKKWAGVLCILFFWTYIPTFAGVIEGIFILAQSDEKFKKKYKCRLK